MDITCMQLKKQQLEPDMEQRTGSKLGKEYAEATDCHPSYLTYMQSTSCEMELDEAQVWIKIAGRNISNLRYADDTTLRAESRNKEKSLLMKESRKTGLKLNILKTRIMASSPITSWQIDGETMKAMTGFILGGSKIIVDSDCIHEIKRHLLLGSLCNPMDCSPPGSSVHWIL